MIFRNFIRTALVFIPLIRATSAQGPAETIVSDHRYDTPPSYVRQATAAELAPAQLTTPVLTPAPILVAQPPEAAPVQLATPDQTPAPPLVAQLPAPAPSPIPQNVPAGTDQRPVPTLTNTPLIPSTALGWAPLMFVGLTLAATGLLLFWRAKDSGKEEL